MERQLRALLIEDDDQIAEVLVGLLSEMSIQCERASDGESGLALALNGDFEIVMLDLMLPGIDGAEICKRFRAVHPRTPLLVISALSDELNTALLLELGADDYVAKPFRKLELKARIKSVMRRMEQPVDQQAILSFGELKIDLHERKVSRAGEDILLTAREFDLLAVLASSPGRPFTRDQLNQTLYGYEPGVYDHSINCHVNRIRSKLEIDSKRPKYLLTKRGVGYYLAKNPASGED